jgi:hypothetical protein
MEIPIGEQYGPDNAFKAAARLHQSRYRAEVLRVGCDVYGNRLLDADARDILNYYDGLGVRDWHSSRLPYSMKRDADMLRSEHIPINMFVPLIGREELAGRLMAGAFGVACEKVLGIEIEYAPSPKENYLADRTAFDVYVKYEDQRGEPCGIGIEVKYTEGSYPIGEKERKDVENKSSPYWTVTGRSRAFLDPVNSALGADALRQIWRNHLLGLAMQQCGDIRSFTSIIIYPSGNEHFRRVIPEYQSLLCETHRSQVKGCTYETFVGCIEGGEEIMRWKDYLEKRYLVGTVE